MVKIGQSTGYLATTGEDIRESSEVEEEEWPAACSSLTAAAGATLSRLRSCSSHLRSEVVPLRSCSVGLTLPGALRHDHFLQPAALAQCSCRATIAAHHVGVVSAIAVCESGRDDGPSELQQLLYSASIHGSEIHTWRSDDLAECSPFAARGGGSVNQILLRGPMVFTAHQDHRIRIWRRSSSSPRHKLVNTLPTATDYLLNCFSKRNYVQVRRHHQRLWIQHVDTISALAVGGEEGGDEFLYSASWDKTFKVWRLSDLKCMESVVAHNDALNALIVGSSAAGQQLVYTASSDGTVKAWAKETHSKGRKLCTHSLVAILPDHHKGAVNALALSCDGTLLFSAGSDGAIMVWRRSDGDAAGQSIHMTLRSVLEGHKRAVLCLCMAGDLLLSGSADKTLRAWLTSSLDESCTAIAPSRGEDYDPRCLAVMQGHKAPIKSVCASPGIHGSGHTVYSGGLDRTIKVWWFGQVLQDDQEKQQLPLATARNNARNNAESLEFPLLGDRSHDRENFFY